MTLNEQQTKFRLAVVCPDGKERMLFKAEYVNVFGVPLSIFQDVGEEGVAPPPPKPSVRIEVEPNRNQYEIRWPNVLRIESVLKRELVMCTALGVGAAVAAAGMISFVGLVVPHLVRLLAGPDHRVLLPASVLAGATLLLFADLIARLALAPAELPIGIVTAFLGAPFFLYLLLRGRH